MKINNYYLMFLLTLSTIISLNSFTNHEMTIFVHGTIKPPEISVADLIKIIRDKVDNTIYSQVITHMRKDPELSNGQIMQGLGLKRIDEKSHLTLQGLKNIYEYQYELFGKKLDDHYLYTFGWNGLLSWSKRYKESEFFYEELHKELDRLAALGIYPSIRIITFSHGGNVALNISIVKEKDTKPRNRDLIVDELIMLAVPVQAETDQQIASPFFKKIYHCYSNEDNIQTMDFFSSQRLFSNRFFKKSYDYTVPENVTQIQLRITKRVAGKKNVCIDPEKPHTLLAAKRIRLEHKDPSHTEMFHFKWATNWYNKKFPLNPLPIVALLPTIIHTINTYTPDQNHIIFDYCPSASGALLKQHTKRSNKCAVPFLTEKTHQELWKLAKSFEPENFSLERQKEHMALALKRAQTDLEKTKSFKKPRNKALAHYFEWATSNIFDELPEFKKFRKIHLLSAQF